MDIRYIVAYIAVLAIEILFTVVFANSYRIKKNESKYVIKSEYEKRYDNNRRARTLGAVCTCIFFFVLTLISFLYNLFK